MRLRTGMAVLGLLLTGGLAGVTRADSVDDYLRAEMAHRHLPGLSVAVMQDGKLVKSAGYGFADVRAKTVAMPATVYGLGSCTKPITALAVLKLVEAGRVGLDEPIVTYLSGLPDAWKGITVRHMLTHTSGLPNYRLRLDLNHLAGYTQADSVRRLVAEVPLDFAPGTRYEYSNTNYHLLAEIIEKVSGRSYLDFVQSQIFRPAGLTGKAARPVTGYLLQAGANVRNPLRFPPAINTGDSGLVMTAPDLAAVCAALDAGRLLRPATVCEMETAGPLADGTRTKYGLGWVVGVWKGHRLVGHSGAVPGYSSTIYRLPDDNLSIVLLSNTYDGTPLTDSMALGVAKIYLPDMAKEDAPIPDVEPMVTTLLKQVLADLAAGRADSSYFTPTMNAALTPAVIAQTNGNLSPLGELDLGSLALMKRTEEGGLRVYRYRVRYGDTPVFWTVHLTNDSKIAGLAPQAE